MRPIRSPLQQMRMCQNTSGSLAQFIFSVLWRQSDSAACFTNVSHYRTVGKLIEAELVNAALIR